MAALPEAGRAQPVPARFELWIAPQPLEAALQAFARQSGLQVLFFSEVSQGLSGTLPRGRYSGEQALCALLAGSGLGFRRVDPGTYIVGQAGHDGIEACVPAAASGPAPPAPEPRPAAAATLGVVQVTGSHIDHHAPWALAVSTIEARQLDRIGSLSLVDALRRIPAVGTESRGPANVYNGAGAQGVSLRGLGAARTLTLVDGMRLPAFSDMLGNMSHDVGALPSALLSRIEVLGDGASTAYGADAVAGVVNFRLLDRYDGGRIDLYTGFSSRGDVFGRSLSLLYGNRTAGGRFLVAAQWQRTNPLPRGSRAWGRGRVTSIGTAVPGSNLTPGGQILDDAQRVIACFPGEGGEDVFPDCPRYDNLEDDLLFGQSLAALGLVAEQALGERVSGHLALFHSQRRSEQSRAAVTVNTAGITGAFPAGFRIPADAGNHDYGQDVALRWQPSRYGVRRRVSDSALTWLNLGLSGDLGEDLRWELRHAHGLIDSRQFQHRELLDSTHLYRLLVPAECLADPACAAVGPVGDLPALLAQREPLTPGQVDYLYSDALTRVGFTSAQTRALLSGALGSLPAGRMAFALGLERRQESGEIRPDAPTRSGEAVGVFVQPMKGGYRTAEAFAELDVPLTADTENRRLDLNLQARRSDFSNFGGAGTYKLGLQYDVPGRLRLRGGYGTSFRAPSLIELYQGYVGALSNLQDPCARGGLRASDATVAANCAALGVPEDFEQISFGVPSRSRGDPALRPERGRSRTLGVVYVPAALPQLQLSLDHYRIHVENAIADSATVLQQDVNACYARADFLQQALDPRSLCHGFGARQENGAFDRIDTRLRNIRSLSVSGVDVSLLLRIDPPAERAGSLDIALNAAWLRSFVADGVEYAGSFVGGVVGDQAYPRWRGNLELGYSRDASSLHWVTHFVGAMRDSQYGTSIPVGNPLGYRGTSAYFSHDLTFRHATEQAGTWTVGVSNLLDRKPPYTFTSRQTLTLWDQVGRYYFARWSLGF